jgi:hypothetical protein
MAFARLFFHWLSICSKKKRGREVTYSASEILSLGEYSYKGNLSVGSTYWEVLEPREARCWRSCYIQSVAVGENHLKQRFQLMWFYWLSRIHI